MLLTVLYPEPVTCSVTHETIMRYMKKNGEG